MLFQAQEQNNRLETNKGISTQEKKYRQEKGNKVKNSLQK